jgi:hypothetical protein
MPKALVPINVPSRASAPTVPTLLSGDLYYNTSTGLMVYDGASWVAVSTASSLTEIDAGVFDGIAPYNGGDATTTSTQTVNGGTP